MTHDAAITVRAAAKINLSLRVGPRRDDGFHELATVYQAIGLYDDVTVTAASEWAVELSCGPGINGAEVPVDENNIAIKAGRLLNDFHRRTDAALITIEKGIPVTGGLAGGSADAAATLVALDRLWDLQTTDEALLELAAQLGSDVPFALVGGTASGTGRGEVVQQVLDNGSWWWVILPDAAGLSTPAVYAELDRLRPQALAPAIDETLLSALSDGDHQRLAEALDNDMTPAAVSLRPELAERLEQPGALLSGSGPTCLWLCPDRPAADQIRKEWVERGIDAWVAPGPVAGAHLLDEVTR